MNYKKTVWHSTTNPGIRRFKMSWLKDITPEHADKNEVIH